MKGSGFLVSTLRVARNIWVSARVLFMFQNVVLFKKTAQLRVERSHCRMIVYLLNSTCTFAVFTVWVSSATAHVPGLLVAHPVNQFRSDRIVIVVSLVIVLMRLASRVRRATVTYVFKV